MNQSQFLAEVFRDTDTVTVSAKELQNILIDKASIERQLSSKDNEIERLTAALYARALEIEQLSNRHITLDLTA